jgi:regulatory protein
MRERQAVTAEILEGAAARYLERYASSRENLRRVLLRRVARAAWGDAAASEAGKVLVAALIARYVAAGLLDDGRYAEAKAAGLARSGASRFQIRGKLMQKGVARDDVDQAVAALEERGEVSEAEAARAMIRRKRLGPYRPAAARAAFRHKDVAALARAGFAIELAQRLLGAPTVEALEQMVRGED